MSVDAAKVADLSELDAIFTLKEKHKNVGGVMQSQHYKQHYTMRSGENLFDFCT